MFIKEFSCLNSEVSENCEYGVGVAVFFGACICVIFYSSWFRQTANSFLWVLFLSRDCFAGWVHQCTFWLYFFFYIFHSRSVRWASRTCVFVLELMCPMIFGTMDTSGGCVTISCCVPLFLPALALSFLLMVCVWFPGYFCLWYKSYFFIKLVNSLFWWLPGRVVWI